MKVGRIVAVLALCAACRPSSRVGPYVHPAYTPRPLAEAQVADARECPECPACPRCPEERRCQRIGQPPARPDHYLLGSAGCHDPFSVCLTFTQERELRDYVSRLEDWAIEAQRRCGRRE